MRPPAFTACGVCNTARAVGGRCDDRGVTGFDITSLLDFKPPRWICPACRGLVDGMKTIEHEGVDPWSNSSPQACPVCLVEFIKAENQWNGDKSLYAYMRDEKLTIDHKNLLPHSMALAELISASRGGRYQDPWPTMRTFFEVISRASYFVHFTSWGISHQMIGALKMASMKVPVYGFVSSVESHARAELTEYPTEAPKLTAQVVPTDQGAWDAPHQKLLIVDGLVAFKGSTNLTNAGARKADRALDLSEVVTDFAQVARLNNTYFAPVWRRLTAPDDTFVWDPVPF